LPATTEPRTLMEAPRVTAPATLVFRLPTKKEFAPSVAAPPMHQLTFEHDAPFARLTILLAAVLKAAGVEKEYEPAPSRVRVPVKPKAAPPTAA